jgi:hypothetical protein
MEFGRPGGLSLIWAIVVETSSLRFARPNSGHILGANALGCIGKTFSALKVGMNLTRGQELCKGHRD